MKNICKMIHFAKIYLDTFAPPLLIFKLMRTWKMSLATWGHYSFWIFAMTVWQPQIKLRVSQIIVVNVQTGKPMLATSFLVKYTHRMWGNQKYFFFDIFTQLKPNQSLSTYCTMSSIVNSGHWLETYVQVM